MLIKKNKIFSVLRANLPHSCSFPHFTPDYTKIFFIVSPPHQIRKSFLLSFLNFSPITFNIRDIPRCNITNRETNEPIEKYNGAPFLRNQPYKRNESIC